MSGRRFVGLSSQQPVPQLLSIIKKQPVDKVMREVPVDAPPLSSSDSSDEDGLPSRGDILPTLFADSPQKKDFSEGRDRPEGGSGSTSVLSERLTRTRTSAKPAAVRQPFLNSRNPKRQPEMIESDSDSNSPALKKFKRSPPRNGNLGSQLADGIFGNNKSAVTRTYRKARGLGNNAKQKTQHSKTSKRLPKKLTPEPESPERQRPTLPPSPPSGGGDDVSPARKMKVVPDINFESPAMESPDRKWRFKMPDVDNQILFGTGESFDASQRPIRQIPDAIPDSFVAERSDLIISPTAGTSTVSKLLREPSSSPLTDLELVDPGPVCPLCQKGVDKELLDAFKAKHPRMRVSQMRKFCEWHKERSARDAWAEKGYPDISWDKLDARIARHYSFLRKILEGSETSHYRESFEKYVKSGRNRTLFQSDANLTPGYYGLRGLRAMTENLISEFAPLLRKRSREDRLVAARGHTTYLQSVLVPELAVRLIMEDMSVDEDEARRILFESSGVGELLNDEIPDVVELGSDDEDDGSN